MPKHPPETGANQWSSTPGRSPVPPPPSGKPGRSSFAVYRIAVRLREDSLGYAITHGHPELRAELVNRMEVGDDLLLIEARLFGPGAGDMSTILRGLPFIVSYEVQREHELSAVYRITLRRPVLWNVLRRHRILTRYPLVFVDGWVRFETLAPASQVRQFVKALRREVGPSRVEAVRQGSINSSALGLTASQLVVFRQALAAGYFSSPRRTSVTRLAAELRRSKSTVSEQLARIQRRLAESALRLKLEPAVFLR